MTINKREELKEMGFEELPHFTVGNSLHYDLGRNRILIFSSIETPNEMLFLGQKDDEDEKKITDLIVLRNYDFDGFTYINNIKQLIESIKF